MPVIRADGIVRFCHRKMLWETFQRIFNLPVTGEVDFATWYKISQIYVGVSRIAELN